MVTPEQRSELNRLLASAIANANCGNTDKAWTQAIELNSTLVRLIRKA